MGASSAALQNIAKRSWLSAKSAPLVLPYSLDARLAPHLGEEQRVVDEDAVDALLVLVEEANLLADARPP